MRSPWDQTIAKLTGKSFPTCNVRVTFAFSTLRLLAWRDSRYCGLIMKLGYVQLPPAVIDVKAPVTYLFFPVTIELHTGRYRYSLSPCTKVVFDFQPITISHFPVSTLSLCIQHRSHLPHMKPISTKFQIAVNVVSSPDSEKCTNMSVQLYS